MRVTIIGGGVLGTTHALIAGFRFPLRGPTRARSARRAAPPFATSGWSGCPGQARRTELAAALRARELWEELGARIPGIGFRPDGSLTLLRSPGEFAVGEDVGCAVGMGAPASGCWNPPRSAAPQPALRGKFLAGAALFA